MDAQVALRSQGSWPSQAPARRGVDPLLAVAARAAGAVEPVARRQAVEPVFRRPSLEPAVRRPAAEPAPGLRDGAAATRADEATLPKPPAAPPFELQHFLLIPPGAPANPRGYAVYSQQPRPEPVPVVLIDTAA